MRCRPTHEMPPRSRKPSLRPAPPWPAAGRPPARHPSGAAPCHPVPDAPCRRCPASAPHPSPSRPCHRNVQSGHGAPCRPRDAPWRDERATRPDETAAAGQRRNIPTGCSPHPDDTPPPMALSAVHRLASAVSPCLSLRVSTLLPRVPGSAKKFCFRLLSSGWPSPASMTSRPDRCLLARESGPIHPAAAHDQDRTPSGQTIHPFSSLFRS